MYRLLKLGAELGDHRLNASPAEPARHGKAKRTLRCVFVYAPATVYADPHFTGARYAPLWAYTLAAHIPQNGRYQLSLHDARLQNIDTVEPAEIFLFSGMNQDCDTIVATRDKLKSRYPRAVFLVGGPICWSFDQTGDLGKLDVFDHVCIGDGEGMIADILDSLYEGRELNQVIRAPRPFDIREARPLHAPFFVGMVDQYYGAMLEVSRGCPFLCEFCDVRILPDNNRAKNYSADLIISELDRYCRLGVHQVMFVCDNFIGDPRWAEEVVDRMIAWQDETGLRPSIFTESTINLCKHKSLMAKMRRAGFDLLHIGVESFSDNSLLETAKVQNSAVVMVSALRTIQSHGFIVAPGLIFGFDSDGKNCFDLTLNGLLESGLLAGDPSLLTALPGTPHYRRKKLSSRLREERIGVGYRYQTNIKYLLPRQTLIQGMRHFFQRQNDGAYQYARLKTYFDNLGTGNFVPLEGQGYVDIWRFAKIVLGDRRTLSSYYNRLLPFLALNPAMLFVL